MAAQVYFGNANFQTWISAPQSGLKASSVGWSSEQQLLNGRSFIKRSQGSHRRFDASWLGPLNTFVVADSLQTIKDFHSGIYGTGPFYWNDPYAVDTNLMPPHWAVPALAEADWPDLDFSITPTFAASSATGNNYPLRTASYSMLANEISERKLTLIIPTGYTLSFGWHTATAGGSAGGGAGMRITPYLRSTGLATTIQNPSSLQAGGTARVSTVTTAGVMSQFDGATYSKVDIYLANGAMVGQSVTLHAMVAQILPTGTTPATGPFLSGRGTTKLEFASSPEIEYYSSAVNSGWVGMSASLVEVD